MTFHILYRQQLLHSASSNLGGAPLYISAAYFVTSWKIFQTYMRKLLWKSAKYLKSKIHIEMTFGDRHGVFHLFDCEEYR